MFYILTYLKIERNVATSQLIMEQQFDGNLRRHNLNIIFYTKFKKIFKLQKLIILLRI